jgi:HlyD family secretion protein
MSKKKLKNVTPPEETIKQTKDGYVSHYVEYAKKFSEPHVKTLNIYFLKLIKISIAIAFFFAALFHKITAKLGLTSAINKMLSEALEFKKSLFDDNFMIPVKEEKLRSLKHYIDQPLHFAFAAVGVFILFFLVWGSLAPLDSAAVAPGYIISQSNNKIIQHQEGGVIERILINDGDEVHKDQILIILNDTAMRAKVDMIRSQLRTAKAIETRLNAEKEMMEKIVQEEKIFIMPMYENIDQVINSESEKATDPQSVVATEPVVESVEDINFNDPIFDLNSSEVQKLLRTQNDLYQTNHRVIISEISVLHQRVSQRVEENKGLAKQYKSLKAQVVLFEEELRSLQPLTDKQLFIKSKLLETKRHLEDVTGSIGRIEHQISANLEAIAENKSHITKTISDHFRDVYRELREAQGQVLDLQEQFRAASDVLIRTEIKSPVDGYVTNLAYHTIGGVVQNGGKILEIVPREDKLIVEARVSPRDIESIHIGLPSKVQLSAYKSKLVPRLNGSVVHVSADRIYDPQNHMQPYYYIARVEINQDELDNLNYNVKLIPGMPAEVYIVKGTRTLLQLLMSPLVDSFHKAFKES